MELLSEDRVAELRDRPLTYTEVGATSGELPPGWRHQDRSRVIGTGPALFAEAGEQVWRWQVQLGAGLRVRAEAERVEPDAVVEVGLGVGPVRFWAPCRIVAVVDEPDRRGFVYGTLPGHAEVGEESFCVTLDADDVVRVQIRAFSRQGPLWARLADPAITWIQHRVAGRYLHALD